MEGSHAVYQTPVHAGTHGCSGRQHGPRRCLPGVAKRGVGATLASEAWWERGEGCARGKRGNPTASQGSDAVARRKVNSSECRLLVLGGVLGKVKLPLRLHS